MNCPICHEKSRVTDSRDIQTAHEKTWGNRVMRAAERNGIHKGVVRERVCHSCNHRFHSHEIVFHVEKIKK